MHTARLKQLNQAFHALFGVCETAAFIAPGRIEVCGNHTDHQNGCVIAAAIDLYAYAIAAKRTDEQIHLHSKGFAPIVIDLQDLNVRSSEVNTPAAFVRGIVAYCKKLSIFVSGFTVYMESDIPVGSGLSSSASFSLLIAQICNAFFAEGKLSAATMAASCQYAESFYYEKPSGLMDQTICSVGGLAQIDFSDPATPLVHPISFCFADYGYQLYVVNTGSHHADLTALYAAIPQEMGQIAGFFGKDVLRECNLAQIVTHGALLRQKFGDRAFLRALHFFMEQNRVVQLAQAFTQNDMLKILALIKASGVSSAMYLQNIYDSQNISTQPISLALGMTAQILNGEGAFRVHGGGFAGTIFAIVPTRLEALYVSTMESFFGKQCALPLQISAFGAQQFY